MNFRNHPTVYSLRNKVNPKSFSFSRVSVEKGNAQYSHSCKDNERAYWLFLKLIGHFVKIYIDQGTFVSIIKYANITLVFKKQKFERKLPPGSYFSCHLQNLYQTFIQRDSTFHGSIFLKIQWWLLQVVQCSVFPLAILKKLKRAGGTRKVDLRI